MYQVVVAKECGCFRRSGMEKTYEMESKDEALLKSIEMRDIMNDEFCDKHRFSIQEFDDVFMIVMGQ